MQQATLDQHAPDDADVVRRKIDYRYSAAHAASAAAMTATSETRARTDRDHIDDTALAVDDHYLVFHDEDTSQQKILFCIGPKRSGKGTFARILTALLGKNSVGGPTMSSFGTQFGLAPLITKSLAIVSDARIGKKTDRAAITERLLTISGEDTIDIDRKYGTMWTGRLPTRIAILTNELPAFSEGSGALAGRFLVIMFQHSFFGREDPGLTDRLMTELPGILNWAIEGYERLQARGHFVQPANALEQIEAIERLGKPPFSS
jgi:putative DNA primase/helicase